MIEQVRKFLEAAGEPVPGIGRSVFTPTSDFYANTAVVEATALEAAFQDQDKEAVLLHLSELLFAAIALGLVSGLDIDCAWLETVRAQNALLHPDGRLRRRGGVVIKPAGWVPPNMAALILQHPEARK